MSWKRSITIERPPSDVWVAFTDLSRAPETFASVLKARWVEGAAFRPGSVFEVTHKGGKVGREGAVERLEVVACEPWHAYTVRFEASGCVCTQTYSFHHDRAWTKVTIETEVDARRVRGHVTRRLVLRRLEKACQARLEHAKKALEQSRRLTIASA